MVGDVIADRYELEELIGSGGMSRVYRARDRMLERHVAIKILLEAHGADDESVERFRREARAVAQLSHPGIVTVIDRGEDGGRQYIVFEHVDGEDLKQLAAREAPLPVRDALDLAAQVGRALAFAHAAGLVHRDVKPQNVLIDGDGRVKVTDFGIARSLDVEHGVTQTGTVLGTSNYIAPEQAGGRPVDEKTDIYSLGVVLFELLTGDVPFTGESFVAVALRHVNEPAPRVIDRRHDVPLRVSNAVERAMAKEPSDRFPSMDAFVAELEACLAELGEDASADATRILPAVAVPGPERRRAARGAGRPRERRGGSGAWLWVAAALAAVVIAGVGAWALLSGGGGTSTGHGGAAIALRGVASYDPQGGDGEHDERVADAADGDPSTYWPTETYNSFGKEGVGLVLDAGRAVAPKEIVVTSSTPGFDAEIRAGSSPSGPFRSVSSSARVGSRTTFALHDANARYFLVWITSMPPGGSAHLDEVTARG